MPTITPGSKVLVTGATGFIGIWVTRTLLEKGYLVRGTVRSASKGKYLTDYFKSYGEKFETAIVEDISKVSWLVLKLCHRASDTYWQGRRVRRSCQRRRWDRAHRFPISS